MVASNFGKQIMNGLPHSGVGLVDTGDELGDHFEPSIDTNGIEALNDRSVDFTATTVGEPKSEEAESILKRTAR